MNLISLSVERAGECIFKLNICVFVVGLISRSE